MHQLTLEMVSTAKASQESPRGLPHGNRNPSTCATLHCFPGCISQKLDSKWSSKNWNPYLYMLLPSQAEDWLELDDLTSLLPFMTTYVSSAVFSGRHKFSHFLCVCSVKDRSCICLLVELPFSKTAFQMTSSRTLEKRAFSNVKCVYNDEAIFLYSVPFLDLREVFVACSPNHLEIW